ncbi:hypothetical protein [Mesorhizobium sp. 8]|uniref:hypothetical protein n=1 Tax=Mesorhizobium sp. 8 TaxID=2584466 RepID=UPI00111E44F7|nr:hypothetical protein [Mesorhizobium sp. 8]QDC00350.1 hypothetical protein FGU64_07940 [Mesorhizobium sp. 8]
MPDFVIRTLGLREAYNINNFGAESNGPGTLEAILRNAHKDESTVADRTILSGDLVVQARNFRNEASYQLLHLVAYVPDDKMQVVPLAADAGLQLADPPENTEYLDGEMMLLVQGNDVLMCKCGLSESVFLNYVEQIGMNSGFSHEVSRCTLGKRVNIDKMALIAKEGVHRLTMNAVAHSVSVDEAERSTIRRRFTGSVLDELRDILGLEAEVPEEAENIKVEVSLSFDKRHGAELEKRQLQTIAESVLDEGDEGFSIETMTGRKVRSNDILLSKTVTMSSFGKSVRHEDAWGFLIEFNAELRAAQND